MRDASRSRIDPRAGFAGPGVKACRECGMERPHAARWRTFCSESCIHDWKIRSQPAYAAKLVLERDHGVCVSCSLDCVGLLHQLLRLPYATRQKRMSELGLTSVDRRLWEMDHIVPVVEGGGSCGLDNLRTLCWRCHRRVTAELRQRLAEQKREARRA